MAGSKPAALPLGDAPVSVATSAWHSIPGCSAQVAYMPSAAGHVMTCPGMRANLPTFVTSGNPPTHKFIKKQLLSAKNLGYPRLEDL